MSAVIDSAWVLAAGGAAWATGAALQGPARVEAPPDPDRAWRAAGLGFVATSAWVWVLLALGLPLSRWMLAAPAVVLWSLRLPAGWRGRAAERPARAPRSRDGASPLLPRLLVLAGAAVIVGLAAWRAWSHTMDTPAGMGIWGYKAKLFWTAGWPAGYLTDPARAFAQLSYPPGFPLAAVWFSAWVGRYDDHLLQVLPVLFLALALLYGVTSRGCAGRRGWTVACVACALFGSVAVQETAESFYPEPLLWFLALVGLSGIARGPDGPGVRAWRESWLLAGACGWVKNEGLLVVVAAVVAAGVVLRPRRPVFVGLGWALAALLPWRAATLLAGVGLEDFHLAWPGWAEAVHRAAAAWSRILQMACVESWRQAFVWPLAAVTAVAMGRRIMARRAAGFALVFAAAFTVLLAHIFMFSTVPDFDWHLASLERLLVLPAAVLLTVLAAGVESTEESR